MHRHPFIKGRSAGGAEWGGVGVAGTQARRGERRRRRGVQLQRQPVCYIVCSRNRKCKEVLYNALLHIECIYKMV